MTALLALGSSLLWGAADFLGGTASRRLPAYAVIGGSQAIALLGFGALAWFTGAYAGPAGYLPWAVLAGLLALAGLGAFYSALADGTMGVVAPIAATGVVVPVAFGLARGERPGALQLVGIAAACAGVVLASGQQRGAQRRGGWRPIGLALVAAAGFGGVSVLLALGARTSVLMTLVGMRATTVGVLAGAALVRRRRPAFGRADLPLLAVIGVADAAAVAAYARATTTGALSLVAVLAALYPAVTVLLARRMHAERLGPVQGGGVLAALAGVVLIAAGGGAG